MRNVIVFITIVLMVSGISSNTVLANEDIYRWVDKDGVVHFGNRSDAAADAEPVKIRKSPEVSTVEPEQFADPPGQSPSYAQQLRDERAKHKKDQAAIKAELDKECAWHRQVLASLEPRPRVLVEQEDGTVVRMDDNERVERIQNSKDFIAKNCN